MEPVKSYGKQSVSFKNGSKKMKLKEFMRLQLFAEEPTPSEPSPQDPKPGEPADPKTTDPKPDDPAPQPKYTDEDVDKILNQKFAE